MADDLKKLTEYEIKEINLKSARVNKFWAAIDFILSGICLASVYNIANGSKRVEDPFLMGLMCTATAGVLIYAGIREFRENDKKIGRYLP
jgi:hypothetical protein